VTDFVVNTLNINFEVSPAYLAVFSILSCYQNPCDLGHITGLLAVPMIVGMSVLGVLQAFIHLILQIDPTTSCSFFIDM
jgi:disulfide bond formation protein DsbB